MTSKSINIKRQIMWVIIAVAALALLFGMWSRHNLHHDQNNLQLASASVLPQAKNLNHFQLLFSDHRPFTNDDLTGHWSMLFFGFTNCPDLCPTTLTTLNETYKIWQADKLATLPQIIFISVDPERDTPPKINEYLKSFNTNFLGATGTKDQLDKLTQQLSVLYMKVQKGKTDEDYTIDHSGTILVIDPKGNWYALFNTPHDAKNIAKDFETIVANYSPENG